MFACLYRPPHGDAPDRARTLEPSGDGARRLQPSEALAVDRRGVLAALRAAPFLLRATSSGVQARRARSRVIDISGLERLLGTARRIGEELRRTAAARGVRVHVAVAGTQTAAMVLARAPPGLTVVARGDEADRLAPLPIGILEKVALPVSTFGPQPVLGVETLETLTRWGLRTLGDLAALPPADLGGAPRPAGADVAGARARRRRPPARADARRGAVRGHARARVADRGPRAAVVRADAAARAVVHASRAAGSRVPRCCTCSSACHAGRRRNGLRDVHARRLELPTPMRDVRALRTLALLDLESHPPAAAIDRVTIVIDPTPGRVLQHTLFTRAHPTPEQLSTLDRAARRADGRRTASARRRSSTRIVRARSRCGRLLPNTVSPARRRAADIARMNSDGDHECRVPAACAAAVSLCRRAWPSSRHGPVRVTTDRRASLAVRSCSAPGPWRTSGNWWTATPTTDRPDPCPLESPSLDPPVAPDPSVPPDLWDRDEWDVALSRRRDVSPVPRSGADGVVHRRPSLTDGHRRAILRRAVHRAPHRLRLQLSPRRLASRSAGRSRGRRSAIRRWRCSIATASTARRAFTRRARRPASRRSSAPN